MAYMERKRFEARLIAIELAKVLNGQGISAHAPATTPNRPKPAGNYTRQGQKYQIISADAFMRSVGAKIE